jgi:regulator of protease activity HflC (stomatin/prohibitin superfamily)
METDIFLGVLIGFTLWFLTRYLVGGIYTVDQNERAVRTSFGRAERVGTATTATDPIAATLDDEEKQRYNYPQVRVIMPGGPYFKWPWQRIYKVSVATQTVNMAFDPELPAANHTNTIVEAVTKDQLNTGLTSANALPPSKPQSIPKPTSSAAPAASPSTTSAKISATSMNIWIRSAAPPTRVTASSSTPR